jgi:virginiamycin B lyase
MRLFRKSLAALIVCSAFLLAQSPPTIRNYPTPTPNGSPFVIVNGPDNNLWFTEQYGNFISQITTSGSVTEFGIPTAASGPAGITVGPDGALWFVEANTNKIGRITTGGAFTEFTIPTANSGPAAIVTGPDGNLWFTEFSANQIGQMTPGGVFKEVPTPTANSGPHAIVVGTDGNMWFTEFGANQVANIATNGAITEFPLPVANSQPSWITAGPDGNLWFTQALSNNIGRITTNGVVTEFPIPTANSKPEGITVGPDGALWFTEYFAYQIGRITTSGVVKEYQPPQVETSTGYGYPWYITLGPDNALWFTYEFGNDIGRVALAAGPSISSTPLPGGTIGVGYSAALTATGGTPPYRTWTITTGALPPGLALNSSTGAITGTPTTTGTFSIGVTVLDSAGATSAVQNLSVTIGQAPCVYTLSSNGQAFSSQGGAGTVAIATGSTCSWSVSGLPAWITLTSPASGAGNATVNFQVAPNTGGDLSGAFTIAGQTFTVEQETLTIPGLSFIGSMPHVVAEGGWLTTFTFVNKSSTAQTARTNLFSPTGAALQLPIALLQQPSTVGAILASSLDQTIAANAQFVIQATGPANVAYAEGSAQLNATGVVGESVDGFAIFHFNPTNQEAVVPMETRNAASYILPFDNTNGVLTGVAIENIAAQSAQIPVIIRNDAGTQVGTTGTITLNALGHTSFVLSTQFASTANIRGTVEFDTPGFGTASAQQISVLGIRYTGGTLTTIPVLADVGTSGGLMAHLASGNGWQTTFALVNTGSMAANATLNFYADSGAAQALPLTVLETGATLTASTITQPVGPNASVWIQSAAPAAGALLSGSAQLATTGNVSGYAIFRYNPNGQEAVVPIESRNAGTYLIAFDNTGGTVTGLAISSSSAQSVTIPVTIRNDSGVQVATPSTIQLGANGHTSFTLAQQFPATANIRGTVEFDTPAGAEISVLGIRSPPALTFTTLPALAK